jgi:hypothetical protein
MGVDARKPHHPATMEWQCGRAAPKGLAKPRDQGRRSLEAISIAENAANCCTFSVRKHGGKLLTSTGLA